LSRIPHEAADPRDGCEADDGLHRRDSMERRGRVDDRVSGSELRANASAKRLDDELAAFIGLWIREKDRYGYVDAERLAFSAACGGVHVGSVMHSFGIAVEDRRHNHLGHSGLAKPFAPTEPAKDHLPHLGGAFGVGGELLVAFNASSRS